MDAGNLELGIMFLTQTGVGIFGNFSLLCFYSFYLLTGHKVRPTDLILNQLTLANFLVLLSKGIPQTILSFGWKYFLDSTGCKLVLYLHRVATGVSFSTLCLLNGFQVIKLNPHVCRWMELKIRSLEFIGFCCFLCWVLHLLIHSCVAVLVYGPSNSKNLTIKNNYVYCFWKMAENHNSVYAVLYNSPNMMSLAFMVWASSFMVLVLHRHKQRIQYVHSHCHSSRLSHESRATCTILIQLISFFAFYSIYAILNIWMTLVANPGQWTVNSSVFVASCFPAFSPFVLIISDNRVSQFCTAFKGRSVIFKT